MSKSIMQKEKSCYITGRTDNLQKHHIFYGRKNRAISEKRGFWVWLTGEYHNQDSAKDVHHNPNAGIDLHLKQTCQTVYEKTHTRTEFIALIGRSYL